MTEVPKIVHDRLQAAAIDETRNAAEPMHPDANLLAAFAEQSLTATERDGVLEHLARCGNCRDTVALALPAENVGALPTAVEHEAAPVSRATKPVPQKIFAWPSLRWAALAAGIAVAGSLLLLRPGKLNQPPMSQQIASTAAPSPAAGSPSVGSPSTGAAPIVAASTHEGAGGSANADEAKLVAEAPLSKDALPRNFTARLPLTAAPPPPPESGMLRARNKKSSEQADKLANMPSPMALDDSVAGETGRSGTLTSEVSASVTSRDEAPAIEKAKPALQGTAQVTGAAQVNGSPVSGANQQQASGATTTAGLQARAMSSTTKAAIGANPTSAAGFAQHDFARHNSDWAISAGILQRSLDGGQTWQDNLHADHALLCYTSHSNEIWAGGQAGALYRSIDGGVTWTEVHPTAENRQLTADINRIELRNPGIASNYSGSSTGSSDSQIPSEIVVSTSNKESWRSTDGGKSWKAK